MMRARANGARRNGVLVAAAFLIAALVGCTYPADLNTQPPPAPVHFEGADDAKYLAFKYAVYLGGVVPNNSIDLPLYRGDFSDIDDFVWQRPIESTDVAEEGIVEPTPALIDALLMPDELTGGIIFSDLPFREALFVRKDGELFRVRQPEIDYHPRPEVREALLAANFDVIARADARWWRNSWGSVPAELDGMSLTADIPMYVGDFTDVDRFVWWRDRTEHELLNDDATELIAALRLPITSAHVSPLDIAYRYPSLYLVDVHGTFWRVRTPTQSINGPLRDEVDAALQMPPFVCVSCVPEVN